MEAYNPQVYSEPMIKTVGCAIAVAPAPGQYSVAEFNAEDLEFDEEAYVERIVLTEDTLITGAPDPGASWSVLPLIRGRWWMAQGMQAYGEFVPLPAMDTRRPAISPIQAVGGGAGYQQIEMEMRGPRILNPEEAIFIEWENPSVAGAAAFPAGQIHAAFHGTLLGPNWPFHLFVPINVTASGVVSGPLVANATSPTNAGRNNSGYPFQIDRMTLSINSVDYPVLATDARIWRHLRIHLVLGEGRRMARYGDRAPLVAYGDLLNVPQQSVDMNFRGRELPLNKRGAIKFEFRNYDVSAADGTQLLCTFWAWRKPRS